MQLKVLHNEEMTLIRTDKVNIRDRDRMKVIIIKMSENKV